MNKDPSSTMPRPLCATPKPLPLSWIKIGSLIPDPRYPRQDAQRPFTPSADEDYVVAPVAGYSERVEDDGQAGFGLQVSKILAQTLGWDKEETRNVTAVEGNQYALTAPNAWFRRLAGDANAKTWLQATLNAGSVYLIAGLQTLTNAKYRENVSKGWNVKAKAAVPDEAVAAAVTGGTLPLDLGGLLEIEDEVSAGNRRKRIVRYTAPEEQVFLVDYQRVQVKWYKRKDVDNAFLGERVQIDLTSRAGGTEDEEKVSVAVLGDDLDVAGEKIIDGESVYIVLDPEDDWE